MRSLALTLGAVVGASGFEFLSIGDWGDSGAKDVAPAMGKHSPEFVLALGDNFYDSGVKSVDDPQFKSKFEDTFTQSSLQVPWYVGAGNHDYYGGTKGVEAEIEYSQKSTRWNYPSLYYSKDLKGTDGTTVTLVSVDTWRINGGDTFVAWDSKRNTGVVRDPALVHEHVAMGKISTTTRDLILGTFPVAEGPITSTGSGDDTQLQWLDGVLSNSTADWKIVMGHFPVHSATKGEHGDTPSLKKFLEPILEKHNVLAYFSGHDHILQHISINGVNYLGSGAGARTHSSIDSGYSGLKGTLLGTYGFMKHTLSASTFTTTFYDKGGKAHYSFNITK
eukprot:Hpha_TRINITY_DN15810_c1_g6::TRINITY_DN15810_c1_g6_i1::g.191328::m.191328/K14379/ACP5; tartrate-resistant acid phosphatase type 5